MLPQNLSQQIPCLLNFAEVDFCRSQLTGQVNLMFKLMLEMKLEMKKRKKNKCPVKLRKKQ